MPTCRRKRVVLCEPSEALLQSVDPNKEVFFLEHTGEIFETYEYAGPLCHKCYQLSNRVYYSAYAARMSFYRLKQFQCEVTGKSGLDYFQALESEQMEARTMHSRFSEPLKPAVLKAVQWRTSLSALLSLRVSLMLLYFTICRGHGAPRPSCRSRI
jgi:bromodomain adjacent to zinc finger domain protein 1A